MTNPGDRQESIRAITGTTGTYNGDWHAAFDADGIPVGKFNGRLVNWLQNRTGSSSTSLSGLQVEYAVLKGADSWNHLGTFNAAGAQYDGTNDYQARGADLTGAADAKKFIFSFWFLLAGGDGNTMEILRDANVHTRLLRQPDNAMRLIITDGAGTEKVDYRSSVTSTADATWHHLITSGDVGTAGARSMYLDGVSVGVIFDHIDATLDLTSTDWGIGASPLGSNKFNGSLAELYVNFGENIDLTVAANRLKFRTSNGKPAFLNADGSLPTGTAPIIYAPDGDASDDKNKGTGGGFTTTGALVPVTGP